MFRRMAIMLVAVGLVFAAVFGFQAFKARMIQKAIAGLREPAAGGLHDHGRHAAVAGSPGRRGQHPGRKGRRSQSAGCRDRQGDPFPVRRKSREGSACWSSWKMPTTSRICKRWRRRRRWRSSTMIATASLLKTDAVSQQTADTDLATLKNDQAQVAQQQALVDYKSIKAPFSGRLGITAGRSRPVYRAGHADRDAAAARSRFLSTSICRSRRWRKVKVGQAVTAKVDTYPDLTFAGKIHGDQPARQYGEPECPGPRDVQESGRKAAARDVCDHRHRCRRAEGLRDAAEHGDLL